MSKDSLGDRVKRYEAASSPKLLRRVPVIIRVDGKAFHTFTKGCRKPFDDIIIKSMEYATQQTAHHMQGFKLAYIQSDEATFMLTDFDTLETSAWFDYELNKLVSITASTFTAFFNSYWYNHSTASDIATQPALFDARAFNVPHDDWPNVFIWRQRDWERNSVQMLARSLFSQKTLQGENIAGLHQLIQGAGKNWHDLPEQYKWGTFVTSDGVSFYEKVDYNNLIERVKIDG